LLEPHLHRNNFGHVIIFQTILSTSVSGTGISSSTPSTTQEKSSIQASDNQDSSSKAMLLRASSRLPRFDDLNFCPENSDQQVNVTIPGMPHGFAAMLHRRGIPRQPSQRPQNVPAACVILLASGTTSELKRVGEYLAALFPSKAPLYFRRLRGTATDAKKSDLTTAFANDPRADPSCLTPDWHTKHAELRVSKPQRIPDVSKHNDLPASAPRPINFIFEQRTPPGGTDWTPYPPPPADSLNKEKDDANKDSSLI